MSYSVDFPVQVEFVKSEDFGLDNDFLIGSEGDEEAVSFLPGTLYLEPGDVEDDLLTPYLEETIYLVEPSGHWVVGLASRGEFFIEEEGQASSVEEGKAILVGTLQARITLNSEGGHE